MPFTLSQASLDELKGVHPKIVAVVKRAIVYTTRDFKVQDGVRTAAEAARNVAKGVSKTTRSKHLLQIDGFSHAVDLVPFKNGRPEHEDWSVYYDVPCAMARAAAELKVPLIWGAVWDKPLGTYGTTPSDMKRAVEAYTAARRKAGKSAFIDGPHFELI